jgi:hypothetical protein
MNRDIRRLIAASELLGGIFIISGYTLLVTTGFRLDPAWQAVPGLVYGVSAMAAGIALFRGLRWGVPASVAVQALQVVSVSVISQFRYVAFAGPLAQLVVATTGVRFNVGGGGAFVAVPWSLDGSLGALGANLQAGVGFQPGTLADSQFTVAINFAAIYFLMRLIRPLRTESNTATGEVVAPAA